MCLDEAFQRSRAMISMRTVCLVVASVGLSGGAYSLRINAMHLQAVRTQPTREAAKKAAMPTELTYPQVYVTSDGETHFREVRVPLTSETTAPPAQPIAQSELQAATTIRHAAFPRNWGVYDRDHGIFHNASSARFITIRRGLVWIRTSDGDTRQFRAGDVVDVLDVAPSKGHITWVGGEQAIALFSNHR
jgi:hypothetical protein